MEETDQLRSHDGPIKDVKKDLSPVRSQCDDTPQVVAWLWLVAMVALTIGLPILLGRGGPEQGFDDSRLRAIQERKPDYLFVGNSMVSSCIDHNVFSRKLHGARSMELVMGGLFSSHWYLWLKNDLVPSGVHPKRVFIFFRRDELTSPYLAVTQAGERRNLARASVGEESELNRVLDLHRTFLEKVDNFFFQIYPLQMTKSNADWLIDSLALTLVMPEYWDAMRVRLLGGSWSAQKALNVLDKRRTFKRKFKEDLFNSANFRQRPNGGTIPQQTADTGDRIDFLARLPRSLLPQMVSLAQEHNLKFVFVMVRPKPDAQGHIPPDPEMTAYTQELRDYLEQNGMAFHNFNNDPFMGSEDYHDRWHIANHARQRFTEHFIDSLAPLL